ncbi:hypothetical protein GUITHDRAFT_103560 [Guillardia theta CCMP2712]|uniref:Uncharacterized protein n=1 Tax=Guillardia theta (strain CCMP2712) TaxID=905079 RepID=L1JS09_GUITC|nr:hypothetical protein GUITHDRAFT_103560 [Guillardia theta CCMP2712]EKX50975.1 hypothetical protein GUITHDRAFT_103560 [Guillardia theta CCMP2712]|eukprot:XP_005837955.1 hypothetical protein GUITHDRAFT_103560 [Guillardia theta CCMP2712]
MRLQQRLMRTEKEIKSVEDPRRHAELREDKEQLRTKEEQLRKDKKQPESDAGLDRVGLCNDKKYFRVDTSYLMVVGDGNSRQERLLYCREAFLKQHTFLRERVAGSEADRPSKAAVSLFGEAFTLLRARSGHWAPQPVMEYTDQRFKLGVRCRVTCKAFLALGRWHGLILDFSVSHVFDKDGISPNTAATRKLLEGLSSVSSLYAEMPCYIKPCHQRSVVAGGAPSTILK